MQVRWYGQSAFSLDSSRGTVMIDPFGDLGAISASRGMQWDYPAIQGVEAALLLITHEHIDHNAAEVIGGEPVVLRSTAGRLESPIGEVLAVASEHDERAGTERGPNTIFVFELDGLRISHFGDFGQAALRPEQTEAIGRVDLLFLPVGGGPVLDAGRAAEVVSVLAPRIVVPMHYRTERIAFLDPADEFLARYERVERPEGSEFSTETLPTDGEPLIVVPAAP